MNKTAKPANTDGREFKYTSNHVISVLLLTVYVFYAIYFAVLHSVFLSIVNSAGVLTSLLSLYFSGKRTRLLGGLICFAAYLAVYSLELPRLGLESGFQYSFLALFPYFSSPT